MCYSALPLRGIHPFPPLGILPTWCQLRITANQIKSTCASVTAHSASGNWGAVKEVGEWLWEGGPGKPDGGDRRGCWQSGTWGSALVFTVSPKSRQGRNLDGPRGGTPGRPGARGHQAQVTVEGPNTVNHQQPSSSGPRGDGASQARRGRRSPGRKRPGLPGP